MRLAALGERLVKGWERQQSRFRRRVHYVTADLKWSFYWDGHYITEGLKSRCGVPAVITGEPWHLRNQILHFGDRYAFFSKTRPPLHPSNDIFLTWFHGHPDDPEPAMRRLFSYLPDGVESVRKIVVPCERSRQVLVDQRVPEDKIVRIPLGVDLSLFSPATTAGKNSARANLGIPETSICIGSFQKDGVGWEDGLEPKLVKGPDVFLDAMAALSKREKNLMVLLTGPARGYVKYGLDKLGIPHIHRFLENYQDIAEFYRAIDLYLISSRDEGGPKGLLESWATGVPVVSTRVGMAMDIIEQGENGLLAAVEDADALAEHALSMISDPGLRQRCIERGLKDVSSYDWGNIAEAYYELLYKPILEGAG